MLWGRVRVGIRARVRARFEGKSEREDEDGRVVSSGFGIALGPPGHCL